ncbi:MAG: outer membrane beta-barrel protein [Acidobacteria bacterium]|nr:outer membrane beta-barrel protein [Acidobacteriota bacterium]
MNGIIGTNLDGSSTLRWSTTLRIGAILLVFVVGAGASQVHAVTEEETGQFELFVGSYDPGPDFVDDDTTFGFRLGYTPNDHFTWLGAVEWLDTDGDFSGPVVSGSLDYQAIFIDSYFIWNLNPESRWVWNLYAGPGFAFVDLDATGVIEDAIKVSVSGLQDDQFTVFAGGGAILDLSDKVYLRFTYHLRWYEDRDDEETDTEGAIAFGWNLGG